MAIDKQTLAVAKKYTEKVGSTITGTNYDYDTGKLTFDTDNGQWAVTVNNGMNSAYKQTLDNISYDNTTSALEVNGVEVLTKENIETENINFTNMF